MIGKLKIKISNWTFIHWLTAATFAAVIFLLFWRLGRPDIIHDDALYAFRSIGLVDFLFSDVQTTPIQWFNPVPWWAYLSFHDAPPLYFIVQHFFFDFFGISSWSSRLTAAFGGIASMGFIWAYLRQNLGLRGALGGLLAVAVLTPFYWLQRLGYLESLMTVWIAGSLYFFHLAKKNNRWYLAWGGAVGLALLTKYTAVFVLPPYFLILLIYRRNDFKKLWLWLGAAVLVCLQLPVIIYNFMMYQATGHMDVQISALLGMSNRDWPTLKTSANVDWSRVIPEFLSRFLDLYSWPVVFVLLAGIIFGAVQYIKHRQREYWLLAISLLFIWLIIIWLTRTDAWFIATGYIFVGIFIAPLIQWLLSATKNIKVWLALLILIGLMSLWYCLNTNHWNQARGRIHWSYSSERRESFGYNQIESFISERVKNKLSGAYIADIFSQNFDPKYFRDRIYDDDRFRNDDSALRVNEIFVYDTNVNWFASLWYFHRWALYGHFIAPSSEDIGLFIDKNSPIIPVYPYLGVWYFSPTQYSALNSADHLITTDPEALKLLTENTEKSTISGIGGFPIFFNVYYKPPIPKP